MSSLSVQEKLANVNQGQFTENNYLHINEIGHCTKGAGNRVEKLPVYDFFRSLCSRSHGACVLNIRWQTKPINFEVGTDPYDGGPTLSGSELADGDNVRSGR